MGCTVPNISMETFQDRNHGKEKRYSRLLLDLPSDLLISILTFLEASDLPMAVCKSLRYALIITISHFFIYYLPLYSSI